VREPAPTSAMPEAPSVSVITPAFNAAATLIRAFQSLQAQTFTDWEQIIVDDGSRDDTARIASELSDPRVKVLVLARNGGTGAALNTAIRHATGRYIAFLDADDEYLPNHLTAHVAVMDKQSEIDMLWGGLELVVSEESQAFVPDMVRGHGVIHASECMAQGTHFVRRRVFDSLLYSEDRSLWHRDLDLAQRAEAMSFKLQRFHAPTYRYYRDTGSSEIDRIKAALSDAASSTL
jgi:glycosyltransferase involved in cell wall biosynthesis